MTLSPPGLRWEWVETLRTESRVINLQSLFSQEEAESELSQGNLTVKPGQERKVLCGLFCDGLTVKVAGTWSLYVLERV